MADKFGLAKVFILVLQGTIFGTKHIFQSLDVVLFVDCLHSLGNFFIGEPKVAEHLPYLDAPPMVVAELVVAIGTGTHLVVNVLLLNEVVHDVVGVMN